MPDDAGSAARALLICQKKIPKGLIGSALLQIKSHIWIQDLLLTIKKSKTRPKHAKVGLITGE